MLKKKLDGGRGHVLQRKSGNPFQTYIYQEPKWPLFCLKRALFRMVQPPKYRTNRFQVFLLYIHIPGFPEAMQHIFPLEQLSGEYDHFGSRARPLAAQQSWMSAKHHQTVGESVFGNVHIFMMFHWWRIRPFFHRFRVATQQKHACWSFCALLFLGKNNFWCSFLDQNDVICWIIMLDSHRHLLVVKFYGMEIELSLSLHMIRKIWSFLNRIPLFGWFIAMQTGQTQYSPLLTRWPLLNLIFASQVILLTLASWLEIFECQLSHKTTSIKVLGEWLWCVAIAHFEIGSHVALCWILSLTGTIWVQHYVW